MNGLATIRSTIFACTVCGLSTVLVLAQPPESPWLFDVVRLQSGSEFRGLILKENPSQLSFMAVRRQVGRPTVCLPTSFSTREISQITRLTSADREKMLKRVEQLQNEPVLRESRLKTLELKSVEWDKKRVALQYQSDWFVLESDAPELIVRRAAIRLEEIFAAFGRFISPRQLVGQPTTIRMMRSCEDYRKQLKAEGRQFDNSGYYDPAGRIIVCASDLDRLGDDMARVRQQHQQINAGLDQDEARLTKLYKGPELLRHIQPIRETRRNIEKAEKQNESTFAQSTRSLFALLAHEAFHAYVDSGADLPAKTKLPRWLNEGLAQVFESAIVEGGELRLGHADPNRLLRIKELTRRNELMTLEEILRTRANEFQDNHGNRGGTAEQRYLTVWGLAMYLTFDRQNIGGKDFNAYLVNLSQKPDVTEAFSQWLGGNIADVERDWHKYLLALQTDGTRAKLNGAK